MKRIGARSLAFAALSLALLVSQAVEARTAEKGNERDVAEIMAALSKCKPVSAHIVLIDEDILTRASISPERALTYDSARHVRIGKGDPRLARLAALVAGLRPEKAAHGAIDVRTLLEVKCSGEHAHRIAAAKSEAVQPTSLDIDGAPARTFEPFRAALEELFGK